MSNTPVMKQFSPPRNLGFGRGPSFWINNRVLAANTAVTETIPSDAAGRKANMVIISSSGPFFVAYQQVGDGAPPVAAVPVADVTNGTGVELNPTILELSNGEIAALSIVAPATTILSLSYYVM